jgi:UDP-N-acetylglucosamine diphosphorylase/glucosamine-1-phosphate N-acetyltransferase
MRLCIFEDRTEQLEPLSLTRPVFNLRCGFTTLAAKQARHVGATVSAVLIRPVLEELYRLQAPGVRVNDMGAADWGNLLLVNGRWLPPDDRFVPPTAPCVGLVGEAVAYVWLNKSAAICFDALPELLDQWRSTLPAKSAGGRLINYPWELVEANADEIRRDFAWLKPSKETWERRSLNVTGPLGNLWIASSAQIEPMVLADTRQGPVVIDEHAVISAFTRLEGPCYIGARSQVFGAKIRAGTSIGPHCRVGGEVEASILHGYSNKYHDGFLGHSYVGEWVNLGAGTHNSDLRNDYGEVTVIQRGLNVPTGMSKVGCFLGDHTKTGLGTLLNTGTSVGAFCSLLPAGRFAPKYVPSFTSWWNGSLREAFTRDQLLTTAEIAMARRGVTMTAEHTALYAGLWEDTKEERRQALRESDQRQLRKSA